MSKLTYLAPQITLTESAREYFDMLRLIPVQLEDGRAVTLWEICDTLLKNKRDRLVGKRDPYTDRPISTPARNDLQEYTEAIRKTFRKRDRIVWAMRYVKYWMALELKGMAAAARRVAPSDFFSMHFGSSASAEQPALDEIVKRLSWLPKDEEWWNFSGRISGFAAAKKLASSFSHLMDFADAQYQGNPLQTYAFDRKGPVEIYGDLTRYERDIMDKRRQVQNAVNEQGAPIVRFRDGSAWFDLKCPFSREEGSAMGHCGNTGAGAGPNPNQTVLSYRLKTPREMPGKWIPQLTFILHQGSILGEMKGRFNEKPDPKYHPQIVELLKQPFIKQVVGGGYRPTHNFCLYKSDGMSTAINGWTDLSPDLAKALHEAKPEIYYQGTHCNFCANTMPEGQEFDRSDARSLPYCSKYRAIKAKAEQPTIGQKLDSIGGTADEGRPA